MKEKTVAINDLTQGDIAPKLIRFSLPFMASNLMHTLYTLVDMAVVGRYLGSTALSAASISGQLTMMLYAMGIGLGTGGQVLIAQYIGANRREELRSTIATMITFCMLTAVLMAVIGIIFARQLMELLNTPAEAMSDAISYMVICCIGILPSYTYNTFSHALRGMGDSRTPFIISTTTAVMNVILDLVFVAVLKTGVTGAAWATVISQVCSCIFAVAYLYPRRETFHFDFKLKSFRIYTDKLKIIVKLSLPLVVSTICINVSMLFVNSYVNPYGVVASAVNGVGNKLNSVMSVVTNSTQAATASFVGQNIGAGKPDRAKKSVWCAIAIGVVFWVIVALVCTLFPTKVFGLFATDQEVLDMSVIYLRIAIWTFLAFALMAPCLGLLNGIGLTHINLAISLLDGVAARIGLSLLFGIGMNMGLEGFWIGNALACYVSVILGGAYFLSGRWRKHRLV